MKRKSFIATALATLFLPALSFAGDGAILYDLSNNVQMTLTPSFSTYIGTDQTIEGDKFFKQIDPALYYELAMGAEGSITSKSLGPDYKVLLGAAAKISDGSSLILKLHEKDFTDTSTMKVNFKEVYIGIGSLYGNLKYGRLAKNPGASIVDLLAESAIYGRFDGALSRVARYESPDINGVTFTLSKGKTQRVRGYKNIAEAGQDPKFSAEELYLGDEKATDYNLDFYGATVNYQLADFALKYAASVTKDGITAVSDAKEKNAFAHRFEATYTKNDLVAGLGYQYAQTNTGFDTALEGHNETLTAANAQTFFEGSIYKTHELIASTSYTIGKFVPKAVFVYGLSGKKNAEDTHSKECPAYFQAAIGVDYNFSEQTVASLSLSQVNRIDSKGGAKLADSKHFGFGIAHSF